MVAGVACGLYIIAVTFTRITYLAFGKPYTIDVEKNIIKQSPWYAGWPRVLDQFTIFIWPFKTDVLKDYGLYRELGLGGFQVDRGKGQQDRMVMTKMR